TGAGVDDVPVAGGRTQVTLELHQRVLLGGLLRRSGRLVGGLILGSVLGDGRVDILVGGVVLVGGSLVGGICEGGGLGRGVLIDLRGSAGLGRGGEGEGVVEVVVGLVGGGGLIAHRREPAF